VCSIPFIPERIDNDDDDDDEMKATDTMSKRHSFVFYLKSFNTFSLYELSNIFEQFLTCERYKFSDII
jgi:hypothetical protein